MKKKMLFFVNPNAGHAAIRSSLMDVLRIFSAGGYDVTVHPTTGPKNLTHEIVSRGAQFDLIVCTGGDGTLNEAVSGLMQLPEEIRPPLGYIPSGTVNDVAFTLGLPLNPIEAAKTIVEGWEFAIDIGSLGTDRWFTYVAAFGLFTDVSYETPQADKRALGRLCVFAGRCACAERRQAHPYAHGLRRRDSGGGRARRTRAARPVSAASGPRPIWTSASTTEGPEVILVRDFKT